MNRLELIDTAAIPGEGGELRLFKQGEHYAIKLSGIGGELMNTRTHGSEDALAERVCQRLGAVAAPRLLIGGLGMGFTLAAALRELGPQGQVLVAELVPGVIRWNRELVGEHAGWPLRDPRAQVHEGDVAELLRTQRQAYDGILLDVDNGPDGLTHEANGWLYGPSGLRAALSALRPRGILAIWSAGPDPRFSERLRRAGFQVEEVPVRAHGKKGARHMIWLAQKPALKA